MKHDISPKQLNERIQSGESVRIIDVRSPSEFAAGHLPHAINIPLGSVRSDLLETSPDETVVFVCHSGMRSSAACDRVLSNFPTVYNLVGGTSGWIATGLEVESIPKEPWSLNRQAHLVAGLILCTAAVLYVLVGPVWGLLALLPTFGLTLDGLTGICPMRMILKRMPWNAGH
jgi:rhodanese-related sulfurtransferase